MTYWETMRLLVLFMATSQIIVCVVGIMMYQQLKCRNCILKENIKRKEVIIKKQ